MTKKIEVGDVYPIASGGTVTVTGYKGMKVEVTHNTPLGNTSTVNRSNLRAGSVKDPYTPVVVGVGYHGEGKFSRKTHLRSYQVWINMLKRCYCKEIQEKVPTYKGCTVSLEWHNFQEFAEWYNAHPNARKDKYQIDKDILVLNNKTYSASACTLVPAQLNNIVGSGKNGGYGVRKRGSKYEARISRFGKGYYVGTFKTRELATCAHLKARTDHWEEYMRSLPGDAVDDQVKEAMRLRIAKFRKLEEEKCE